MEALLKKLEDLRRLNEELLMQELFKHEDFKALILDLNRLQLFQGKQSDNSDIEGVYSQATESISRGQSFSFMGISRNKLEGDVYFLLNTGEYFNSFKLILDSNNDFEITDENLYGFDMKLRFGDNLLGLTEDSLEIVRDLAREIIIPFIIENL